MKNTIQKTEVIPIKALKWLINNYSDLEIDRQASQSLKYQANDDKATLQRILKNCRKNGTLKTDYKQAGNKERGRNYSSCGLSSLMRELRAVLARDNYYDVDIVNCDPTLMLQFCQKKALGVDTAP